MKKRIKALEIKLKTTKVKPKRIELINELAWELRRLDPKRGLKLSREARKLSEKTNSKNGLACALRNIGACSTWISEYKIALNTSLEALNLFEELNDPENCAKTLFIIGIIFYYIADYDSALRYYLQSLKINEDIENLNGQANSLNGIGLVYNAIGNNDKALKTLLQSLKIAENVKNQDIQARVLESLATYYNHLKQYEQAISYALRCVTVNKKLGDKRTQAYALNTLGESNQYLGDYDMAMGFYQLSLKLRKDIDFKSGQAITLTNIGNLHLLQSDTEKALTYLEKALLIAEKIKSNDINYKVNKALSEVYEKTGNVTEFVKHFKAQYKAKESISAQKSFEKTKGIELQFEMKQIGKEKEILEKSYKNIQILSEIGQQITSALNLEKILNIIYERVNELMDATVFGIGLYKPKEHCIEYRLAIEKGKRYKPYTRDTRNKNQLAVWCINNRKPVLINNVYEEYNKYIKEQDSLRPTLEDETVSEDPVSIIYLPILVKNKVIGIITVQSFKKNSYNDNDMEMLNSIASYAAIALENARLYESMEDKVNERTRELVKQKDEIQRTYLNIRLMNEIGNDITSALSIEKIIETVYENVNALMDASILCIGFHNKEKNTLDFPGFMEKGKKMSSSYDLDDDTRLPVWCFKNQKEIFINDLQKEYKKYIPHIPPPIKGETPNSIIYHPLFFKEKVIGVITVESFTKNAYTRYHSDIIKNLAIYTAIAIENARLYKNMEDEVKQRTKEVVKQKEQIEKTYHNIRLLSKIGQDITATLSVDAIIEKVYESVNTLMNASVFWIGIYNKKKLRLDIQGGFEKGEKLPFFYQNIDVKSSFSTWCFKNKKEILINNLNKEYKNYFSKLPPVPVGDLPASLIYVPLLSKKKSIGVITVQSFKKNAYTDYHLSIIRNLAVYSSIALENAHLYENMESEVRQRTKEVVKQKEQIEKTYQNIKLLGEIGQEITATLSIDTIIEKVYKNVNALMDASIFCIGIYDEQANEIYFQGAIEKNKKLPRFSYSLDKDHDKPAVWCVKNRKEVFINDRSKEYKKYASKLPVITVGEAPESLIYIPLYSKEKPIGVITVQSFKKNAYSKYHLNILRNLAVYSAIALENAHLYENMEGEVKQRTKEVVKQKERIEKTYQNIKLLSEIGQEITATLSVETIIERVYNNVNSLMDASVFCIGIHNEQMQQLDFKDGFEEGVKLPFWSYELNDKTRLAVWCFENQKEIFINNLQKEFKKYIPGIPPPAAGKNANSIIYLPLHVKEKIIGVITVQSFKKNAFSLYHLNILQNLAIYIAIALENAGLYENLENKVKERTAELREANVELKKQRDSILDSINYASRIQEAMLPPIKTVKKFLPDSFIFYMPKDIVSGDFYWFSHRNGKSIIITVDCTGHGVPGALMAMIGNSLLNEIVNEKLITDPAAILNQLHSSLKTTLQQNRENGHSSDGMDMAICSIDKNKKTVRYAGAVCPLFVVNNHSVEVIKANIYSIGSKSVMSNIKTKAIYTNQDIPIQKNMCVYMCSDGFIDQYGGEGKQKFGTPRFKQLLLDICGLDMQQQKASLSQAMKEWKKSNNQIDDILVMGIKF